jgi:transposase
MLQITPQMKILVALAPVDFRKGIDGLVQLCKTTLGQDPMSGAVFAFRNRRGTAVKVLVYDGQGFWLCQKRLSRGHFAWWPSGSTGQAAALAAHQLHVLLAAGNPHATAAAPDWRPVRAG